MGDRLARLQSVPRGRRRVIAEAGRVCDAPGCDTVLSTYNADDRCARHDHMPSPPARKVAKTATSRARGADFSVTITEADGETSVLLIGKLDASATDGLRARMQDIMDGTDRLVVDMGGLTELDAAGLRVLIAARLHARAAGVPFSLTNPTGPVVRALRAAGGPQALDPAS
jgi:anti-anti-sigma factor